MKEHSAEHAADYPSSPFTTALVGTKAFWQNGKSALPGVATVQFFAMLLVVLFVAVAIIGAVVLLLTWFVQASSSGQLDTKTVDSFNAVIEKLPTEFITLANTSAFLPVTGGALVAVGAIGIVLGGTFVQALEFAIAGSTLARRQKAQFGATMGLTFRRMWPLLAQGVLVLFAAVALFVVPGIVFALLGELSPIFIGLAGLFYLSLIAFLIYAFIRLALGGPAVVISGMGPIAGLKYSWQITEHKVGEILGIFAVAGAASTVLTIVFDLLSAATASLQAVSTAVDFLAFVAVVLFSLVTTAVVVERYVQLDNAHKTGLKGHTTDWNSNIAAIGIFFGIGMLSNLIDATINPVESGLPGQPTVPNTTDLQST